MVKKWPKTKRLVENSRNSDFFLDLSVHSFVKTGPWLTAFGLPLTPTLDMKDEQQEDD